jgi:hypothetical protein
LTCSSPTALKPLSFKTVVGASFVQKGSKSAIRNFFPPVSPESQIRSHHPQTPAFSKLRSREKANLTTRTLKQHSQLPLLSFLTGPHTLTALSLPPPPQQFKTSARASAPLRLKKLRRQ